MEAASNGPTVVAPIRPDGSFSFSLRPGQYSIALTGQLFGVYRKSIVYGSTDLLRAPLLLVDSASTEIAVTLTTTRPESEAPGVIASGGVANVPRAGTPGPLSIAMSGTRTDGTRAGGEIPLRADGTFEFLNVPPGSYTARVAGLGVDSGESTTVAVAEKDVTGLALAMTLRLKVSGSIRVVDINGRSLPEIPADAAIYFKSGPNFSLTAIKADGSFTAELPEGEYTVSFRVPAGYATKSISLVSYHQRRGKPKAGTDWRDLALLMLTFPKLKRDPGPVTDCLQSVQAGPRVMAVWRDLVAQEIVPEGEDDGF